MGASGRAKPRRAKHSKNASSRELKEELGINASIGAEIMRVGIPGREGKMELVALKAEIEEGRPMAIEHSEIAWISLR